MKTKTDDIKLPPLPVGFFKHRISGFSGPVYSEIQMEKYARAAVEADRQGRMPSDAELDDLSDEFHGYSGNHTRDGYLIPKFDHIGYARALLSRYSSGQPVASAEPVSGFVCWNCGAALRVGYTCDACGSDEAARPDEYAAKVAAPVAQEPVAVIGEDFVLLWIGSGPIAPIVERHGLKVGSKLYAAPVAAQAQQPVSGADELRAEVSRLQKMFEAADKGMHNECVRGDRLESALRGMLQLDEENHQRHPGDEDVCKEVRDARAALSAHGRHANLAAQAQHPDDAAVDAFAAAMKTKLAQKRAEGRGGWEDKAQCSQDRLSLMLRGHVAKGDPVDVANFAMMLHQRGERISGHDAVSPSAQDREDAARYRWLRRHDSRRHATGILVKGILFDGGESAEKIDAIVDAARSQGEPK